MTFVLTFLIGVFVGGMVWSTQDYIRNTRFHGGTTQIRIHLTRMFRFQNRHDRRKYIRTIPEPDRTALIDMYKEIKNGHDDLNIDKWLDEHHYEVIKNDKD